MAEKNVLNIKHIFKSFLQKPDYLEIPNKITFGLQDSFTFLFHGTSLEAYMKAV